MKDVQLVDGRAGGVLFQAANRNSDHTFETGPPTRHNRRRTRSARSLARWSLGIPIRLLCTTRRAVR